MVRQMRTALVVQVLIFLGLFVGVARADNIVITPDKTFVEVLEGNPAKFVVTIGNKTSASGNAGTGLNVSVTFGSLMLQGEDSDDAALQPVIAPGTFSLLIPGQTGTEPGTTQAVTITFPTQDITGKDDGDESFWLATLLVADSPTGNGFQPEALPLKLTIGVEDPSHTPEPGSFLLLGTGLGAFSLVRRFRRARNPW